LVFYLLGSGQTARIAQLAAVLLGVALLDGCNSLPDGAGVSEILPSADGGGGASFPSEDASPMGTSCHPGNVETFVPTAYRHATPTGQGACLPSDGGPDPIQVFYDDCFGSGMTKAACDGFAVSNPACQACIESAATATAYGPLVLANGFVEANVAGCIEVEAPSDFACAQAQQALSDCELAACAANCPVVDQASLVAYEQCAAEADQGGCLAYDTASLCLQNEVEAGASSAPEALCLSTTFEAFYAAIVPVFCGQTLADGGPSANGSSADGSVSGDGGADDAGSETDVRAPSGPIDAGLVAQDGGEIGATEGGDAK
jgi:hypothetical protein